MTLTADHFSAVAPAFVREPNGLRFEIDIGASERCQFIDPQSRACEPNEDIAQPIQIKSLAAMVNHRRNLLERIAKDVTSCRLGIDSRDSMFGSK